MNISAVRPYQRSTRAQQDQGTVGGGKEDFPLNPHQGPQHRRLVCGQTPAEGGRALGVHHQTRDREIRSRGETKETGLRRKLTYI